MQMWTFLSETVLPENHVTKLLRCNEPRSSLIASALLLHRGMVITGASMSMSNCNTIGAALSSYMHQVNFCHLESCDLHCSYGTLALQKGASPYSEGFVVQASKAHKKASSSCVQNMMLSRIACRSAMKSERNHTAFAEGHADGLSSKEYLGWC